MEKKEFINDDFKNNFHFDFCNHIFKNFKKTLQEKNEKKDFLWFPYLDILNFHNEKNKYYVSSNKYIYLKDLHKMKFSFNFDKLNEMIKYSIFNMKIFENVRIHDSINIYDLFEVISFDKSEENYYYIFLSHDDFESFFSTLKDEDIKLFKNIQNIIYPKEMCLTTNEKQVTAYLRADISKKEKIIKYKGLFFDMSKEIDKWKYWNGEKYFWETNWSFQKIGQEIYCKIPESSNVLIFKLSDPRVTSHTYNKKKNNDSLFILKKNNNLMLNVEVIDFEIENDFITPSFKININTKSENKDFLIYKFLAK